MSTGTDGPPGRAAPGFRTAVVGAGSTRPADGSGLAGGRDAVGAADGGLVVTAGAAACSATGRAGEPHAASAAIPTRPTATRHARPKRTAGR